MYIGILTHLPFINFLRHPSGGNHLMFVFFRQFFQEQQERLQLEKQQWEELEKKLKKTQESASRHRCWHPKNIFAAENLPSNLVN